MSVLTDSTGRRMRGIYLFDVPVRVQFDIYLATLFLEDLDPPARVGLDSYQKFVAFFIKMRFGVPARP